MSAPESTVYRALRCGEREALRGATADEIHVWLELWWGRDSTRIGVVWCRAGALADDLPELRNSRQRVTAALDRLQERGLIRWDAGQKVAVRCGFAQEHMPDDLNRATSWLKESKQFASATIAAEVLNFIASEHERCEQRSKERRSQQRTEQGSEERTKGQKDKRNNPSPTEKESTATQPPASQPEPAQARTKIDPQPLIDAYNELCTRLPSCKGTDKQRTQASKALAKEPDIELWRSRFYAINQSEHHTGRTQANWFASFGWCIDYPDKLDPLVHKFKPPAQQQPQHDRRFDELEEARERNRQFKLANGITD